jgi:hypothetical protein
MSSSAKHRTASQRHQDRLDQLMERATKALAATKWFVAERLAEEALMVARQGQRFLEMSRICLPLQEARRNRLLAALEIGEREGVRQLTSLPAEDAPPPPGCWLVLPPRVGADARRLRLAALAHSVPAAILCREPRTKAGRWPVVAVGPLIIRVHLEPPHGATEDALAPQTPPAPPPLAWFTAALESLGDAAQASAPVDGEPVRRVDALLARLDAHPDHEKLHQALAEACRRAHGTLGSHAPQPAARPLIERSPLGGDDESE